MQQTTLYSPSLLIFVQRDSSRVRAFSSSAIPQRLASPREYRAVKPSWRAVSPVNLVSFVRHSPSSVVLPTDQARCRFCLMQDNLRTISLIALVAAPVIAGLTLSAQAANVVAQELKQGSTEPPRHYPLDGSGRTCDIIATTLEHDQSPPSRGRF